MKAGCLLFVWFWLFEIGFSYVALVGLEVPEKPRLMAKVE